jgi:hypothetical protein
MPAPGVTIELIQAAYHSGAQRIEVDISDQLQKVRLLFANHGFIAILEKMSAPAMAEIESGGVTREHEVRRDVID